MSEQDADHNWEAPCFREQAHLYKAVADFVHDPTIVNANKIKHFMETYATAYTTMLEKTWYAAFDGESMNDST